MVPGSSTLGGSHRLDSIATPCTARRTTSSFTSSSSFSSDDPSVHSRIPRSLANATQQPSPSLSAAVADEAAEPHKPSPHSCANLSEICEYLHDSLGPVELKQPWAPGGFSLWVVGIAYIRGEFWQRVVREMDAPVVSGIGVAPPISPLRAIEQNLAKVTLLEPKSKLPRVGKSNLESAFQHICKTSSATLCRAVAPEYQKGCPVLQNCRDQVITLATDVKLETRRRSKATLTLLSIGCGYCSLSDVLLALRMLSHLQPNLFETKEKRVSMKPECVRVLDAWSACVRGVSVAASDTGAFGSALSHSARLGRPEVALPTGEDVSAGYVCLHVCSTLHAMLARGGHGDDHGFDVVMCHTEVPVLLMHGISGLLVSLQGTPAAASRTVASIAYMLSILLRLLQANVAAARSFDASLLPTSTLSLPPALPRHTSSDLTFRQVVCAHTAPFVRTLTASLSALPQRLLTPGQGDTLCRLISGVHLECMLFQVDSGRHGLEIVSQCLRSLAPPQSPACRAAAAASLAVVALRAVARGGIHATGRVRKAVAAAAAASAAAAAPPPPMEDTTLLFVSLVTRRRTDVADKLLSFEALHAASEARTCPTVIALAVAVLEAYESEGGQQEVFNTVPLRAKQINYGAVQQTCLYFLQRYMASVMQNFEREPVDQWACGSPDSVACLCSLLGLVARGVKRALTARRNPPALFKALSLVLGTLVRLLAPVHELRNIPAFILQGTDNNGPDAAQAATRLVIASQTSLIAGDLFESLQHLTCGLDDVDEQGKQWTPSSGELDGGVWVSHNGSPALRRQLPQTCADAAAVVVSVTAPAEAGDVVVLDRSGRACESVRREAGARRLLFTVPGGSATVTINLAADVGNVRVQWVSLPKAVDALAESLLLCSWLCGCAASAALVMSRVGLTDEEKACANLLRSPVLVHGVEPTQEGEEVGLADVVTTTPSSPELLGAEAAAPTPAGSRYRLASPFTLPMTSQAQQNRVSFEMIVVSESPALDHFLRSVCDGACSLHQKLCGPALSEEVDLAVRTTAAALLKHASPATRHAAVEMDAGRGDALSEQERAEVAAVWRAALRIRMWLSEKRQVWHLESADDLASLVTARATLLLHTRYHGVAAMRLGPRRHSTLFARADEASESDSESVLDSPTREATPSAVVAHSDTTADVLDFVLPKLPSPPPALPPGEGVDEAVELEATLPHALAEAVSAARKEVTDLVVCMARRRERVPHCVAAMRFSLKMLARMQVSHEDGRVGNLLQGMVSTFLCALAAGCRSQVLHSSEGYHPLALLDGVSHAEVSDLQASLEAMCCSIARKLPPSFGKGGCSLTKAALSWFCMDVRPVDLEWLLRLNLVGTLVPVLLEGSGDDLCASVLQHLVQCAAGMLEGWDRRTAALSQYTDPQRLRTRVVDLLATTSAALVGGLKGGADAAPHTADVLSILATLERSRELDTEEFRAGALSDLQLLYLTRAKAARVRDEATRLAAQRLHGLLDAGGDNAGHRIAALLRGLMRLLGESEVNLAMFVRGRTGAAGTLEILNQCLGAQAFLPKAVLQEVWGSLTELPAAFEGVTNGMEADDCSEKAVDDRLFACVAALTLLGGSDVGLSVGQSVEVWIGSPLHARCCGSEEVLSAGASPHGEVERWLPGKVVSVDLTNSFVTVMLDGDSAKEATTFAADAVRHTGDGYLLAASTTARCTAEKVEALASVVQRYATLSDTLFRKKSSAALTRCGLLLAAKALKLLRRLAQCGGAAGFVEAAFFSTQAMRALCSLAARSTSLIFSSFPSSSRSSPLELSSCTLSVAGHRETRQPCFLCTDCGSGDAPVKVCRYCAEVCHAGHRVTAIHCAAVARFVCRCRSSNTPQGCASLANPPPERKSMLTQAMSVMHETLGLLSASAALNEPLPANLPVSPPDHSFECLKEMVALGFDEHACLNVLSKNGGNPANALRTLGRPEHEASNEPGLRKFSGGFIDTWGETSLRSIETLSTANDPVVARWGEQIECTVTTSAAELQRTGLLDVLGASEGGQGTQLRTTQPSRAYNIQVDDIVTVRLGSWASQSSLASEPTVKGIVEECLQGEDVVCVAVAAGRFGRVIPVPRRNVFVVKKQSEHEASSARELVKSLVGSIADVITVVARELLLVLLTVVAARSKTLGMESSSVELLHKALARCFSFSEAKGNFISPDVELGHIERDAVECLGSLSLVDGTPLLQKLVPLCAEDLMTHESSDEVTVVSVGLSASRAKVTETGELVVATGELRFWHADCILVCFKTVALPPGCLVRFFFKPPSQCGEEAAWKTKRGRQLPRSLVLPSGRVWYEVLLRGRRRSVVKAEDSGFNLGSRAESDSWPSPSDSSASYVTFHALPLCQVFKEGFMCARKNVSLAVAVCTQLALHNRRLVQAGEDASGRLLPEIFGVWKACAAWAQRPYVKYKAQACTVLSLLLPQVYAWREQATRAASDGVLDDLLMLRLEAEVQHGIHRRKKRLAVTDEMSLFCTRLLELLALARRFVQTDLCGSYLFGDPPRQGFTHPDNSSLCASCATVQALRTEGQFNPTHTAVTSKGCDAVLSRRYKWVEQSDLAQMCHNVDKDVANDVACTPTDPRFMLGSMWDGALLIPFLKAWQPSPIEFSNACGVVDRLSVMRRVVEFCSQESPYLLPWMINYIVAEALKRVEIEQSDHPYLSVDGEGCIEMPQANRLTVTFDHRCRTQPCDRVVFSSTTPGGDDLGSFGGDAMGGENVVVEGSTLYFKFRRCVEMSRHDVPCTYCKKLIQGVRYHCGNCFESVCSSCLEIPNIHTNHHIFYRIVRPTALTPRSLPFLYPIAYTRSAAFRASSHNTACDNCGVCPIEGICYKCYNCDFNLCSRCIDNTDHPWPHLFLRLKHPLPPMVPAGSFPGPLLYRDHHCSPEWGYMFTAEASVAVPTAPEKAELLHRNVLNGTRRWSRTQDAELVRFVEAEVYPEAQTLEGPVLANLQPPQSEWGLLIHVPLPALRFRFVLLRLMNKLLEGLLSVVDPSDEDGSGCRRWEAREVAAEEEAEVSRIAERFGPYPGESAEKLLQKNPNYHGTYATTFTHLPLAALLRRMRMCVMSVVKKVVWQDSLEFSAVEELPRMKLTLQRVDAHTQASAQQHVSSSLAGADANSDSEGAGEASLSMQRHTSPSSLALLDGASPSLRRARTDSGYLTDALSFTRIHSTDTHASWTTASAAAPSSALLPPQAAEPGPKTVRAVLTQCFDQAFSAHQGLMRSSDAPWKVIFMGEASDDHGGPFRDSLSDMCSELLSTRLQLCTPVPNAVSEVGNNREMWVPNPKAVSVLDERLFVFVGRLMGVALRSKTVLPLDLPPLLWKVITHETMTLDDVTAIDTFALQALECVDALDGYKTTDSAGAEVSLLGSLSDVGEGEVDGAKYGRLLRAFNLRQGRWKAERIREGLHSVVPARYLPLFSVAELRVSVCGTPELDLHVLRNMAVYHGYHRLGKELDYLWQALDEFSKEERALFLKFVWGRTRLGMVASEFAVPDVDAPVLEIRPLHCENPDSMLPTSHTCFFRLELPAYTSYRILLDKLRYAVTHCNVIDTDYTARALRSRDSLQLK